MGPSEVSPVKNHGESPPRVLARGCAAPGLAAGRHPAADERAAFVESLRQAIENGTYRVDSRAVAGKLLDLLFPPSGSVH